MRILVTGGAGFVGQYMARELLDKNHEVICFDLDFPTPPDHAVDTVTGNLLDKETIESMIESIKPDACVHLGAISFVPDGADDPSAMLAVNITGTINIIQAFRKHSPESKILVISTAHVYGTAGQGNVLTEDSPLAPVSTYAVSKAAADITSLACANEYNMHIMTARPNNHIGPGQDTKFSVASFAAQAASIAKGTAEPEIATGNLDSTRNFLDVRDVVKAYRLLLEKGQAGKAYNISSPDIVSMGDILNKLCALAGISPEITSDPEKFRPTDSSPILDIARIRADTGWEAELTINTTLKDILEIS